MAERKIGLKEKYQLMTRGLDWEPSYQSKDDIFPFAKYEGIKVHDWDAWEDPFKLTMDAYWKFQAEKERKLYAVIDSMAQNNGQLGITDDALALLVDYDWPGNVRQLRLSGAKTGGSVVFSNAKGQKVRFQECEYQ